MLLRRDLNVHTLLNHVHKIGIFYFLLPTLLIAVSYYCFFVDGVVFNGCWLLMF
jgi:hypothetical protein